MSSIEAERLQHTQTVGGTIRSRSRASREPWPAFGAGKRYPPPLPDREEYVVEFERTDDIPASSKLEFASQVCYPEQPTQCRVLFSKGLRLVTGVILAFTSLCSTVDSSIFATSTGHVSQVFGVSVEVATLSSSLYLLGYAFGPLIWAPVF